MHNFTLKSNFWWPALHEGYPFKGGNRVKNRCGVGADGDPPAPITLNFDLYPKWGIQLRERGHQKVDSSVELGVEFEYNGL